MRVVVLLIAVTCTSWFWDDGQVLARSICVSRLAQEVNQIRQQALVPTTRLGVYAQTVTEPPLTLIDRDGGSAFIPASNQKILTSAVGLSVLGGNYRIATSLMTELPVQGGEVQGNLWVIGRGDPTLTSDGGLKHLVRQLRLKGIRKIHGSIHLLNKLPSTPLGQGWEPQDLHEYYAAPTSGFTLDENSHYWTVTPTRRGQPVQFRWDFPHLVQGWRVENQAITSPPNGSYTLTTSRPTEKVIRITGTMPENSAPELGGVAIPDPEAYFRERLLAELQAQGIEILHLDSVGKSPEPSVLLAQHLSPPLTEILATINKDSNNLHAEQLLRILATTVNPVPPDTYTVGMGIIRQFLVDRGIDTTGLVIADGSGLSRYNLVTPKMVVAVLQIMAKNSLFRNSLAIAGRDGTLKRRFLRTILADNLRAKTGTITSASALSGYVRSQGLGEIVFSIMINHTNQSTPSMRRVIDRITLLLAHLQRC